MRGLLTASALLAPLLALASPLVLEVIPTNDEIVSDALITLYSGMTGDLGAPQQITLDLRVLESTTSCGYGNVTVSGQSLAQDDIGLGSGNITTEEGNVLDAEWKFSCVHLGDKSKEQLLSFHIDQVDGQRVKDVAFSVQFQQVAPVSIKSVDGAVMRIIRPSKLKSPDSHQPSLEDELAELRTLEDQLVTLERSIASKISHISEKFGIDQPEKLLHVTDCQGIKCLFKAMYMRIKDMASNLYHGDKPSASSTAPSTDGWRSYTSHEGQRPLSETDDSQKGSSDVISSPESELISSENEPQHPSASLKETAGKENANESPQRFRVLVLSGIVMFLLASVLLALLGRRCVTHLRRRRQARWEKRRQRIRAAREACNVMAVTKYIEVLQWLRDSMGRQSVKDEEKQAEARRMDHHDQHPDNSGSDSEDALSTTMEEEIAQFRAAAGAVSNLIISGGGGGERIRGRSSLSQQPEHHHHPSLVVRPRRRDSTDSTDSTPSSIASACPTYRTVDDTLPPYEEEDRHPEDSVADGFRYIPGNRPRDGQNEPSITTTRSSLDRNIGEPKD